jgi:hypothetical protein
LEISVGNPNPSDRVPGTAIIFFLYEALDTDFKLEENPAFQFVTKSHLVLMINWNLSAPYIDEKIEIM